MTSLVKSHVKDTSHPMYELTFSSRFALIRSLFSTARYKISDKMWHFPIGFATKILVSRTFKFSTQRSYIGETASLGSSFSNVMS